MFRVFSVEKKDQKKSIKNYDYSMLALKVVIRYDGINDFRFLKCPCSKPLFLNVGAIDHNRKIGEVKISRYADNDEKEYVVFMLPCVRESFKPIFKAIIDGRLHVYPDFDCATQSVKGIVVGYANPYDEEDCDYVKSSCDISLCLCK